MTFSLFHLWNYAWLAGWSLRGDLSFVSFVLEQVSLYDHATYLAFLFLL